MSLWNRDPEEIRKKKEEARQENRYMAARGIRAQNFMASEFWKENLEPFLDATAKGDPLEPWNPDDRTSVDKEEVMAQYFFNSGLIRMVKMMKARMNVWVQQGREAEKGLREEREREEAAAK